MSYIINCKKILCIIPFYNRAHLLRDAIESVLQQTYHNIELVLINDGSTDDYLEVVNPYLDRPNIHFITYEKNRGIAYARNQGLDYLNRLNCDYFTIHDSDDISDITRFEKIISLFNKNILCVKPSYIKTDLNNKPIKDKEGNYIIESSEGIAFYSKKVFQLLGYFDNLIVGEDTEYYWRLKEYVKNNSQYNIVIDRRILYYARVHNNNTSTIHRSLYNEIWNNLPKKIKQQYIDGKLYLNKFE